MNTEEMFRNRQSHRRIGINGQQVIDKPTYDKLTKSFVKNGGIIIRGDEAEQHLKASGAYASYLPSLNAAFIRDDATVSDVLEEMYHAEQDRRHMFGEIVTEEVRLRREIDAQNHLLSLSEKYKISEEEINVTKANLAMYQFQLENLFYS